MKKIFLTLALVAFVGAVSADEPAKRPSFKGFQTNGFWDNWEISIGGGINGAKGGDKQLGYDLNGSLTKWFHPVVGVRGMLQGGYYANGPKAYDRQFGYVFGHFDAMLNFSNWTGGYREDRVYYAVPFVGAGLFYGHHRDNTSFGFDAGLLNKFRVSKSVDINLEFMGVYAPKSVVPTNISSRFIALSATVGATYRFNKRNFDRTCVATNEDELKALQASVASANAALDAAKAENGRLSDALKKAQDEAAAAKRAAAEATATAGAQQKVEPMVSYIFFNIGSAVLNADDRTRLDVLADQMKADGKSYLLVGYADQGTGSAATNARIAAKRAEVVYNYLIKRGVPASQLAQEGRGNVPDIFKNNPAANRVVVINEK